MSNKQKYLTVLATISQPKTRNSKQAWDMAENGFSENLKLVQEMPLEEVQEALTYTMMGLWFLEQHGENSLFHSVIMDDIRTRAHELTCPNCKGNKEAQCGSEDTEQEGPKAEIRTFSSLEDLLGQLGGRKPS